MGTTPRLIEALHETANRLASGARYEWGHAGRCNAGHLVQTLTELNDIEIAQAFEQELGEWSEHAKDYCNSGKQRVAVANLFATLEQEGLSAQAIAHLEHLSDRKILEQLPGGFRYLERNQREDVVLYLRTMAGVLNNLD